MVHWHVGCRRDENMICKLLLEEERNRLKAGDQPLVLGSWQKHSGGEEDWWGGEKGNVLKKSDVKNCKPVFIPHVARRNHRFLRNDSFMVGHRFGNNPTSAKILICFECKKQKKKGKKRPNIHNLMLCDLTLKRRWCCANGAKKTMLAVIIKIKLARQPWPTN